MTKKNILIKFNDLTGKWNSWPFAIDRFAKRLTKDECNYLLHLAEAGYREFRLYDTHGYVLDPNYKRMMIYDSRRHKA